MSVLPQSEVCRVCGRMPSVCADAGDCVSRVIGETEFLPVEAAVNGWCNTASHPSSDHLRTPECQGFLSEAEHNARMMADATEHDQRADVPGIEARYVDQHRPY